VNDLPLAAELRAHPELSDRPVIVASGPGPRAEIVAISPEAASRGVRRPGSVAHARAICPEICVRTTSPAVESAARAALLDAALSCTPRAVPIPPCAGAYAAEAAVLLDASGITALFRSEAGFAAALCARTRALGLPGNVAVASSRSVAHLAARALRPEGPDAVHVLSPAAETAFLAPLPIDLLDPDDALAEALTRFGVRRVGQLLALPRRALGLRLGPRVLELIARIRGGATEPPLPVPCGLRLVEAIDLEAPVDRLEPLAFALQGLLSRLRDRLAARRLACGDLTISLALEGGGRDARRVGVAAPTLDLRVLVRLLCHALEARPPTAPVESVELETEGRAVREGQLDLFRPAGPAPAVLSRTLAELESLCGRGRVGAPRIADDHREGAFELGPFQPVPRTAPQPAAGGAVRTPAVRALRPPVRAQVRVSRDRPEAIRSAVANGSVVHVAGPWRTTGGWWSRDERFAYDCFDVETSDGTVARLRFDHLRKTWHIDAVYD
jgi:protein ImuB